MIGLVTGPRQVATIAGVTPLSIWAVRAIKAREWVMSNMLALGTALALGIGARIGVLFGLGAWVVIGLLSGITVAVAITVYWAWVMRDDDSITHHWQVDEAWRYDRDTPLPALVRALARHVVTTTGLVAYVEYLDEDPFLFVVVDGRRVYLAHW